MDRKRLLLRDRRLDPHCSGSSINRDLLTRGDALRGSCDPNDRRDPVLAGHDGTISHGAVHFHYQDSGGQEEQRPAGIG